MGAWKKNMSCTLLTLATCFSFANLYIDGGFLVQNREDSYVRKSLEIGTINGQKIYSDEIADAARNPYGRLSLGYAIDLNAWTFGLEAAHVSSVRAGWDRGVNSFEVRARWYPFRR